MTKISPYMPWVNVNFPVRTLSTIFLLSSDPDQETGSYYRLSIRIPFFFKGGVGEEEISM